MGRPQPTRKRLLSQYAMLGVLFLICIALAGSLASLVVNDPNQQVGLGLMGGGVFLVVLLRFLRGRGGTMDRG